MTVSSSIKKAPQRSRRSSSEIKELILSAAMAEFSERGFSGATTASISRRAGVTEAQLFRSFESKALLFREAVFAPLDRHFAEFNARQAVASNDVRSHSEMMDRYIDELQAFIGEHSKLFMSYIVSREYSHDGGEMRDEISTLARYFERGAALMNDRIGERSKIDARLLVRTSFAAVLGTMLFKDWLFPAELADENAIKRSLTSFVKHGIPEA